MAGKFMDSRMCANSQCRRLDQFSDLRGHSLDSEKPSALCVRKLRQLAADPAERLYLVADTDMLSRDR